MRLSIVLFLLLSVSAVNAQQEINQNAIIQSNLSETEKESIREEIKRINYHISAIETKAEYILNDPEEKKIAEEQGWFETMAKTKSDLEEKKKELEKLLVE